MAYGENIFSGMIDENGVIWDIATGRKRQAIGVDSQKEQEYIHTITEMQETLDNWREILLENKLLKIPKTPEEIAQEAAAEQLRITQEQAAQQSEINKSLLDAINNLNLEIRELKNNGNDGIGSTGINQDSTEQSANDSASNKPKSRTSKVSTSTGRKATS